MGNSAPEPHVKREAYRMPETIILDVDESPQAGFAFDLETMNSSEGFWATSKETATKNNPFPARNDEPWPGKQEFLTILKRVESKASTSSCDGHAPCRLQGYDDCTKVANGCDEYCLKTPKGQVSWPSGYYHYLAVHNVKPSKNFYYLIMRADEQLKNVTMEKVTY